MTNNYYKITMKIKYDAEIKYKGEIHKTLELNIEDSKTGINQIHYIDCHIKR